MFSVALTTEAGLLIADVVGAGVLAMGWELIESFSQDIPRLTWWLFWTTSSSLMGGLQTNLRQCCCQTGLANGNPHHLPHACYLAEPNCAFGGDHTSTSPVLLK